LAGWAYVPLGHDLERFLATSLLPSNRARSYFPGSESVFDVTVQAISVSLTLANVVSRSLPFRTKVAFVTLPKLAPKILTGIGPAPLFTDTGVSPVRIGAAVTALALRIASWALATELAPK
jgi:hypothetical protein